MQVRTSAVPFCTLFCTLAAIAQEPPAPTPAPPKAVTNIRIDKDGFVLRAGAIDPDDLVEAAARFLGRNILWTAQEHAKVALEPFVLQKDLALDALGCEEVVSQLLFSRRLALMPMHADKGLYEVVHLDGPRAREVLAAAVARTGEEILRQPELKLVVYTQVKLENIEANIAANALRPFFASNGGPAMGLSVGTAGNNSTLLLQGFQDQVAQALRLLRLCDRPENQPNKTELERRVASLEQALAELKKSLPKPAGSGGE